MINRFLHTIQRTSSALLALSAMSVGMSSCSDDSPTVNLGIDDVYYISRMQKLPLHPALTGEAYRWQVDGETVAETRDYIFLPAAEGTYRLTFDIIDPETPFHFEFEVRVLHEEVEYSPYISRVYEYCPAPGQFVNEMPRFEEGDTYADILKKVEESISGTNDVMVTLGGWGGYITFGFDHTVVNVPGQKDIRIWGNCFYELGDQACKGGSAEAGIVMVSYDVNHNGEPDDPWYELAGSDYSNPLTRHGMKLVYHRPDPDREIVADPANALIDLNYIRKVYGDGSEGYMPKNSFHTQDYWPRWVAADRLEFAGTCLPPNGVDRSGNGSYFVLYCFDWGYADNHPNDMAELNSFDISWAVDVDGNPVTLPGVDFVRVFTGLDQYCGWVGETSTEICRAQDLHIPATSPR